MSQPGVERTLGRMVTDEAFREAFFADPSRASLRIGVVLSGEEIEALRRVPRDWLAGLSGRLDGRICRLHIARDPLPEEQP